MVLGMSLRTFTFVHVALSLIGIGSGFVMALGMVRAKRMPFATDVFLLTTWLTSATGFLFPFRGITPGIVFGWISMFALLLAFFALYGGRLEGGWRGAWVVSAMMAQYLNFFVFIVQLFDKTPALEAMGHVQKETVFAGAQLAALIGFALWTVKAWRKFRVESQISAPIEFRGRQKPGEPK
jgi:hypothetical protein